MIHMIFRDSFTHMRVQPCVSIALHPLSLLSYK